jgi:hypothetical protein
MMPNDKEKTPNCVGNNDCIQAGRVPDRVLPNTYSVARSVLGTLGVLFCHTFCFVVILFVFVAVNPRYELIFRNHNLILPDTTVWVVRFYCLLVHYWYLVILALPLDGIVYFGLTRMSPKMNWLAAVWAFLWPMIAVVLLSIDIIALYLPLLSLFPEK